MTRLCFHVASNLASLSAARFAEIVTVTAWVAVVLPAASETAAVATYVPADA